ncbi:MAG: DUF2207 domain-containing protein [bacterium]
MKSRILFLLLASAISAGAKSYRYPLVHTAVRLTPAGEVHVVQDRTYRFDGRFSWAFVDLAKRGADDITLNGVYELDRDTARPARYDVRDSPASLYVRWEYQAENEDRTFRLDYTVHGAVRRYDDVAELYWKLIEDEHEPVERATFALELPGPSPELFKVFIHSRARPGRLDIEPDHGRADIELAGVPGNAFVELRLLADPALFPALASAGGTALERILAEERSNYLRSMLGGLILLPLALVLVLLLPVLMLVLFYRRWGREPKLDYEAMYEREPPREAPPLAVPAILHQQADENHKAGEAFRGLFAQLVSLAVRGAVTVEEIKKGENRFRLGRMPDNADEFDRAAVGLVFERAGAGRDAVTNKDIRDYCAKNPASVRAALAGAYDRSVNWWERKLGGPLIEPDSIKARGRFLGLALLSALVGVGCGALGLLLVGATTLGTTLIVAAIPAGTVYAVLAVLSAAVVRWSPAAHLEHRRWQKLAKFLREFSALKDAPATLIAVWEQYYIYAVALGVADRFLKNLGRLAAERNQNPSAPVWFLAGGAGVPARSFGTGLQSLSSFNSNFAAMSSAFSPKSSSGGGFSGGGGGGGGGGSSGAG